MKLLPAAAAVSLLLIAPGMLGASSANAATTGSSCATNATSTTLYRGETGFEQSVTNLNGFFAKHRAAGPVSIPPHQKLVDSNAEVIQVETHVTSCERGNSPAPGAKSIGGCSYVGCTGSPGHEFNGMPIGSVVSLSSCGGGIQRSGTFQKSASGWVMTGYKEARVTQCDALNWHDVGPESAPQPSVAEHSPLEHSQH